MAGFAVHLSHISLVDVFHSEPYLQEDLFLTGIGIPMDEIEPKANNCSEVG